MLTRKLIASAAVALVATAAIAPAHAARVGDIVFFGDSLSDTGNIWYASSGFPPPPYNQGSSGAGPDRTGGQWSDMLGPSWPTVLANMYGQFATPSLVGGNNYAWGGARTGVNPDAGDAPWLNQQVGQYLLENSPAGRAPIGQTLFSVMIGGNDVANNLGSAAAIQAGIVNIVDSINALYNAGGRQFLVANVPDVGATPRFQELDQGLPGIAALATGTTLQWNAALEAALGALNLADARIYLLDLYGLGKDPELLAGYANTTDACLTDEGMCADPSTYFYWDTFHPSSTTHSAIARFAALAVGVPEPAALALMLFGLGGMALAGRHRARPGTTT
jgi:outer membrane lipase/esterase